MTVMRSLGVAVLLLAVGHINVYGGIDRAPGHWPTVPAIDKHALGSEFRVQIAASGTSEFPDRCADLRALATVRRECDQIAKSCAPFLTSAVALVIGLGVSIVDAGGVWWMK
ncbi:MAG: hypothetical protein AB7E72_19820 [Lysobacterales bacterium]